MSKSVLGYRSQAKAIEALYQAGLTAPDIADKTGVSRACVEAVLSQCRKRAGIPARIVCEGIWELPPDELRHEFRRRAARGAVKALEAAGL